MDHQPGVQHAFIHDIALSEPLDDRAQNVPHDLLGQRRGDDRCRRVGSHPAGIRPLVAIEDLLVILGRSQGQDMAAICQRQKRSLFAAQKLLNHHLVASRAKLTLAHNGSDGSLGFGLGGAQQDAFPRGQAIGLDHNRRPDFFDIAAGCVRVAKHAKGCGWHALLLHECLGKGFAAFELGRSPVRAKHA